MSVLQSINDKLSEISWDKIDVKELTSRELQINITNLKEYEERLLNLMMDFPSNVKEGDVERTLERISQNIHEYESYIELLSLKGVESEPVVDVPTQEELNLDPIFIAEKLFEIQKMLEDNTNDFNKYIEL